MFTLRITVLFTVVSVTVLQSHTKSTVAENYTHHRTKRWSNDNICGLPVFPPLSFPRIVGGSYAKPHSWPWQILLTCNNKKTIYICGGSVINNRWILTAAHCVAPPDFDIKQDCKVALGKHYFNLSPPESTEQFFDIQEYIVHENYIHTQIGKGYDIALMKLPREIVFNDNIRPICLPIGLPELNKDSRCFTSGWGYTLKERANAASALKQLEMPINKDDYCQFTKDAISVGIICAGKWFRAQDLCFGDSGGPLHCRESNGKWYVHGVVSQVDKDCNSVASYTKVDRFLDWIEKKIASIP